MTKKREKKGHQKLNRKFFGKGEIGKNFHGVRKFFGNRGEI